MRSLRSPSVHSRIKRETHRRLELRAVLALAPRDGTLDLRIDIHGKTDLENAHEIVRRHGPFVRGGSLTENIARAIAEGIAMDRAERGSLHRWRRKCWQRCRMHPNRCRLRWSASYASARSKGQTEKTSAKRSAPGIDARTRGSAGYRTRLFSSSDAVLVDARSWAGRVR